MSPMLRTYHDSELSRRLGGVKLSLDNLQQFLLSRVPGAVLSMARFDDGKFVVKLEQAGAGVVRVVRGYGKSLVEALRSMLHTLLVQIGWKP